MIFMNFQSRCKYGSIIYEQCIMRREMRAFRWTYIFSRFSNGIPELSKWDIVRDVIRNWFATSYRISGGREHTVSIVSWSGGAQRSCRIKSWEKEQRTDRERRIVHPPFVRLFVRSFVRSLESFLFAATPYCQVAHIQSYILQCLHLYAGTRMRDATYIRVYRYVTPLATSFACIFSRFCGKREDRVAYLSLL